MNRPVDMLVRDEGVAGSNPATPTRLRTETRTDIPKNHLLFYIYRWDRQGRKGQRCKVTARGKFNSIRVVFDDGYTMITSGNAIRRAPDPAAVRA
jgi:hypothetical protein